jgi:tRNA (guanine-N7-)-methyltransferase
MLPNMIKDDSVSGFHIFFPDPWPKKKHHKRRMIQRPFTYLLANKLTKNGYVYFVTDWEPYAEWALDELNATDTLKNAYENYAPHQEWRPMTKFENKAITAGRAIRELYFLKRET